MFGNDWSALNKGVKICTSWTLQDKPGEDFWRVHLKCNKGKQQTEKSFI